MGAGRRRTELGVDGGVGEELSDGVVRAGHGVRRALRYITTAQQDERGGYDSSARRSEHATDVKKQRAEVE